MARATAPCERVAGVIPDIEWAVHAPYIAAISELKRERNAVILAHNYQTPEIFHGVADITGDSLALAQAARRRDADVIVLAGVHFMAETAKILLDPEKTVLIPDLRGRLLAGRVDHRRGHAPAARALPRRAGGDLRQHVGRGEGRVGHLLHVRQRGRGGRVAGRRPGDLPARRVPGQVRGRARPASRSSSGRATARSTSGSPATDLRAYRAGRVPGIQILAHPECPPDVLAEADYVGLHRGDDPPRGRGRVRARVVMVTECSMSDNVAVEFPDVEFVRPVQPLPAHEADHAAQDPLVAPEPAAPRCDVDPEVGQRAKLALERMLAVGRREGK